MAHLFLLEDDSVLGETMKKAFTLEGYSVTWVRDLRSGLAQWTNTAVDLFILDWNLPDGTGLTLLEKVRESGGHQPAIFLTARTEEETAIQALTAGAKDFLRKPCGQRELQARVKRLLGEALNRDELLRYGDLTLNLGSRKAKFRDSEIEIHGKEFDVLVHLVRNGDIVSSREAILNIIDPESAISDRAVDAHMSSLRNRFRKNGIESIEIRSIYGEGYRLEKAS